MKKLIKYIKYTLGRLLKFSKPAIAEIGNCENNVNHSGTVLKMYFNGQEVDESMFFPHGEESATITVTFLSEPTLQEQLSEAIETENYEEAARIRDEINNQ